MVQNSPIILDIAIEHLYSPIAVENESENRIIEYLLSVCAAYICFIYLWHII